MLMYNPEVLVFVHDCYIVIMISCGDIREYSVTCREVSPCEVRSGASNVVICFSSKIEIWACCKTEKPASSAGKLGKGSVKGAALSPLHVQ